MRWCRRSQKGTIYKTLAQEVLGEKMQVKALAAEATLQCRNRDEVTAAEELAATLKQQYKVDRQRSDYAKALSARRSPRSSAQ